MSFLLNAPPLTKPIRVLSSQNGNREGLSPPEIALSAAERPSVSPLSSNQSVQTSHKEQVRKNIFMFPCSFDK